MNRLTSANIKEAKPGHCCAEKTTSENGKFMLSENTGNVVIVQQFKVPGATSDGCVRSDEQILLIIDGVLEAQTDMTRGAVFVIGGHQEKVLKEALGRSVYQATAVI